MRSCLDTKTKTDSHRTPPVRSVGLAGTVHRVAKRPVDRRQPSEKGELRKIYLEITTDCNLDCRMCVRQSWEEDGGTMSPATWQTLIAQFKHVSALQTVNFSGFGEPTIHPRFFDWLASVKAAGLRAEVVTNGVALDASAQDRLVELGTDRLVVSLDGTDGDGVFHPSVDHDVPARLRELHERKLVRGASRPEVTIEFVAGRKNIHLLPQLKRLGPELGFTGILVTNLVPHTLDLADQILYGHWTTTNRDVGPSPWSPVIDLPRMDPQSSAAEVIEQLQVAGTHLRVCGNDFFGGRMYCRFVNEGCLAIAPDGTVSPCLPLLHTYSYYFRGDRRHVRACCVGNIHETPLSDIWNDPAYLAFRKRVRNFEFSPCIDCGSCELRESNEEDCYGNHFPCCGECLWAAGLVQCP